MKTFTIKTKLKLWRILTICMILSSILLFTILLSSCATSRSVRPWGTPQTVKKTDEKSSQALPERFIIPNKKNINSKNENLSNNELNKKEKNNDKAEFDKNDKDRLIIRDTDDISENIKGQNSKYSNKNELKDSHTNKLDSKDNDGNKSIRMLSLNEQLKLINEEQDKTNGSIDSMRRDLANIKESIKELKGLESSQKNTTSNQNQKINASLKTKLKKEINLDKNENSINEPSTIQEDGTILSDEEANLLKNQNLPDNVSKAAPIKKINKQSKPRKEKQAQAPTNIKKTVSENKMKSSTNPLEIKSKSIVTKEAKKDDMKTERKEEKKVEILQNLTNSQDISAAMRDISKKDYQEAIKKLNKISETDKNPVTQSQCNYLFGEAYFGIGQYDKAVNYFSKVVSSSKASRKDEAQNMIAESLIRSGQIPQAKEAFKSLIAQFPKSDYIPKAKKMLQQL